VALIGVVRPQALPVRLIVLGYRGPLRSGLGASWRGCTIVNPSTSICDFSIGEFLKCGPCSWAVSQEEFLGAA
jgi:hypothetical protein